MDFGPNFLRDLVLGAMVVTLFSFAVFGLVCAVRGWKKNRSRTPAGIFVSVGATYLAVGFFSAYIGYEVYSPIELIFRGDAWGIALFWPVVGFAFAIGLGS